MQSGMSSSIAQDLLDMLQVSAFWKYILNLDTKYRNIDKMWVMLYTTKIFELWIEVNW